MFIFVRAWVVDRAQTSIIVKTHNSSMKKLILSSLLSIFALAANAASTYVTVQLVNGSMYSFLLADFPVITYADGDLVVNGDAATSYAISGVQNYHFSDADETVETGVSETIKNSLQIIALDKDLIQIKGATAGAKVSLFSAAGVEYKGLSADMDGAAQVELPQAKGVYIINVDGKSFKVIRK